MYGRYPSRFWCVALVLAYAILVPFSFTEAQVCTCYRDASSGPKDHGGSAAAPACVVTQQVNNEAVYSGGCTVAEEGKTIAGKDNGLLRDGVFGCNASKYANVGSTVAIGGVYVPVNDAAVTLNTGYLVYKECVLDGVTSKISAAARTQLTATMIRDLNTGKDGGTRYVQNLHGVWEKEDDKIVLLVVDEENIGAVGPAYKDLIKTTLLRERIAQKKGLREAIANTGPSDANYQRAVIEEGKGVLADFAWLLGGNDPLALYLKTTTALGSAQGLNKANLMEHLRAGRMFYGITDNNKNPFLEKILTPAYLVSEGASQAFSAGYRCLEGADELSEMCESMFTAMIPESFSSGLYNMTQSQNGQPSFVTRMVQEASAAVRNEAVNVALANLLNVRKFEVAFLQAKEASATMLTNAINRLRETEKRCWEMIAYNEEGADKHVCSSAPQGKQCTATGSSGAVNVEIATSTQFSQAVINNSIAPLATIVGEDAKKSVEALQDLDALIVQVSDANSAANQRAALSRLDQMIAANSQLTDCSPQKTLHTAGDVQCATKQRDDISGAIGVLVEDTIRAWGDNTDPNIGWCNINNPALIQKWTGQWRK